MDDLTRKYYEATKISEIKKEDTTAPVTWTEIFYKRYPRMKNICLEPAIETGELEQTIKKRKSIREFEKKPLEFSKLSSLLCHGLGRVHPKSERRGYPSGGARFPVETYLMAFEIGGLSRGAYHYDVFNNNLELLLEEDLTDKIEHFLSPYISWAPAIFIFTSVISRSEVKYGLNAYRFSLIEAGHMVQNLFLLCTKYGLGGCPVAGFISNTVTEVLDLTEEELPLYAFACGYTKNV